MDQQQPLITAGETMKRLGLIHPSQLKRLVDSGRLTRIIDERRRNYGFYVKEEVEKLAQQWEEFDRRYIIVA